MNRKELVAAVVAHTGQDKKTVEAVLGGFVDATLASVAKGEVVTLPGFAKFAKVKRAARTGRNPATGETIKIKASVKARITPLKGFKDVVAGTAAAPKLNKAVAAPAPAKAAVKKAAAPAKKAAAPAKKAAAPAKKAAAPAKKVAAAKKK
jgi:DNA-binding protein HU-beta